MKLTYRVTHLNEGAAEDKISVSLVEHDENIQGTYPVLGSVNIQVPKSDAGQFLPGSLYELSLTKKKDS